MTQVAGGKLEEPRASARLVEKVARAIFPSITPFAEVGCCRAPDFDRCTECAADACEIAKDAIAAFLQANEVSGSQ